MYTARLLKQLAAPLLDFLYPPSCLGCGMSIHADDVLCAVCLAQLIPLPVTGEQSTRYIGEMNLTPDVSFVTAAFEHESGGILEGCIHAMKYRQLHRVGYWLGRLAGECLVGTQCLAGDPILLPVPLHPLKRIERGYNQAEEICRGIAAECGLDVQAHMLLRKRYTVSQSAGRLDKTARVRNMRDAFLVDAEVFEQSEGRPLLIVDDLITTGATISACASALLHSGCRDVRVAAVAHPSRM